MFDEIDMARYEKRDLPFGADSAADPMSLRTRSQAILAGLLNRSHALKFACLSTVDGRVFAQASVRDEAAAHRIAAMSSSLLGLSESFARDALRGSSSFTTISTEHGSIIVVRVPTPKRSHVLAIGADASDMMALTLRYALDTAAALAAVIGDRD